MTSNPSKTPESFSFTQNRSLKMIFITILAICEKIKNSVDILYLATPVSPNLTLQYHKRVNLTLKQQNNFRIIFPDPKYHKSKGSCYDNAMFLHLFENTPKN